MAVQTVNRVVPEASFASLYTFPFDPFQIEAMDDIAAGRSVLVSAPTSAGKTVIAEYALWRTTRAGQRAIYTTPIKALSNQKRRDLDRLFPGRIGLLTGDRSENRDADILVMTTEVLRNMLLEDPESLRQVSCVVFDEVHYIADPERGTIWEESIISALPEMQLVCLSATIRNAGEIADWITETRRRKVPDAAPVALIRHEQRPVPLEHYVFTGEGLLLIRDAAGHRVRRFPRRHQHARPRPTGPEEVLKSLDRAQLLPAIWFAFTRAGVESDAERFASAMPPARGERRAAIESAIAWTLAGVPAADRSLNQITRLTDLLRHGIGFHHAGLLPPCKELVEDLFLRGYLSVVCATDTLAVGINMPARTVVISRMSRPVGGLLTANDFSQLTGRAGRRGIDERGAVVVVPSPYHDFERDYAVLVGPLEPVRSRFTLRYSTLLALYDRVGGEDRIATMVKASLRQFQLYGEARRAEEALGAVEAELASVRPIPELLGREEELDEYLRIQARLTDLERPRASRYDGHRGRRRRSERSPHGGTRYAGQIEALRALLRQHPLHSLMVDPGFERLASGRIEILRRRSRLLRIIDSARRERDQDAERTARAVTAVLRRLGYVQPRGLGHKAAGLREMVAPSGIVISELYHEGVLMGLGAAELAEFLSWFACDVDRRRYNSFRLPLELWDLRGIADLAFRRVSGLEEGQGIRLAQGASSWFWGVALAWCSGASIQEISPTIEAGEGDIVSILNKTVDLLDQFTGMVGRYGDVSMLETIHHSRRLLTRGLVALLRSDVAPVDEEPIPA